MKDFIAYCGLDCERCEARLATVNGDSTMIEKVAKHWSELNGVEITPAMIHCTGCRIDGMKTPYCDDLCPIRQCAMGKGYETCGDCHEVGTCERLEAILRNNPDARGNLRPKTVISFYDNDRQEHWLEEIMRSDWGPGAFLHELLKEGAFFKTVGEGSKVLLLTDGDELISYCTYARLDDIQPTELSPWMGFIYTFPEHRGHRYAGLLFAEVERLALEEGVEQVYISTNHIGLYEKYGCDFLTMMNDMDGKPSRVYVKRIIAEKHPNLKV